MAVAEVHRSASRGRDSEDAAHAEPLAATTPRSPGTPTADYPSVFAAGPGREATEQEFRLDTTRQRHRAATAGVRLGSGASDSALRHEVRTVYRHRRTPPLRTLAVYRHRRTPPLRTLAVYRRRLTQAADCSGGLDPGRP